MPDRLALRVRTNVRNLLFKKRFLARFNHNIKSFRFTPGVVAASSDRFDDARLADRLHAFQFLLRAATSPATAPLLSAAVQERFLGPIREWIGGEQAPARARLLAATFIGLLVERLIRDEPLLGEEREQFIEHTGAMLQALVEKS